MKRILAASLFLMPAPVLAQTPPTYTLSSGLIEEIFREMSMAKLQADAQAATIAKLQAEVQHQQAPPAPSKPK